MTTQNASQDLLNFLITQANSGNKNWFGFQQQRIAGIHVAYRIAENHADTMTPEDVADYVVRLNNAIFMKLVRAD
jgi:hypothetical protein